MASSWRMSMAKLMVGLKADEKLHNLSYHPDQPGIEVLQDELQVECTARLPGTGPKFAMPDGFLFFQHAIHPWP